MRLQPGETYVMRELIYTARLVLRDVTQQDADQLFELDSDPEVMRYIGYQPQPDLAEYRDRIRTVYMPWQAHPWHGVRTVLDRTSSEFLGWVFARPAIDAKFARDIGWNKPDEIDGLQRVGQAMLPDISAPVVKFARGKQ